MSTSSKVALGCAVVFTSGMIAYVHLKQSWDRERLHDGVLRDIERQQMKKLQNLKALQDQIELTKVLKEQEQNKIPSAHQSSPNDERASLT